MPEFLRLIRRKHHSLDLAPVVGALGSIPTIDAGHPDVFRRDPTRVAEFCGLCHI